MNFNNIWGQAFAVVFMTIVIAGFALSLSLTAGMILLGVAFAMNVTLYIMLFFAAALNLDEDSDEDFDVHP